METYFARRARAFSFTAIELEIMVGSLLGDATLLKTTRGYSFRVHHGVSQYALAFWKYQMLARFVRTPPRAVGQSTYFRTISHPALTAMRGDFYRGRGKVVPFQLLSERLTPLALAVWVMDDGAADGGQVRLNTQSFTFQECESLCELLATRYQVWGAINRDKGSQESASIDWEAKISRTL